MQSSSKTIGTLIESLLGNFTTLIIQILFALALMYFIFGVYGFVKNAGNPSEREKYSKAIMWGVIGLAVMISVWGLVSIVTGTFGEGVVIPQVKLTK